jgi:hypothetical protein
VVCGGIFHTRVFFVVAKRSADDMEEERTTVYVTRIETCSGELDYSHCKGNVTQAGMRILVKYHCSKIDYDDQTTEADFFYDLEQVLDGAYSDAPENWEKCVPQTMLEKPAPHFIFQGEEIYMR